MTQTLKPFFTFYGGKYRLAPRYPDPECDMIVEPFAGSAGYSVRNHTRKVVLYDLDPIIVGVWDYLIHVSGDEILRLPLDVDHVDDLISFPQEARWLVGFWLTKGGSHPNKTPSSWVRNLRSEDRVKGNCWGAVIQGRLANQVDCIRHWKITQKSWDEIDIIPDSCTFVDPPYSGSPGKRYTHNQIDHDSLGFWCRDWPGQVIACDQVGATWLPFASIGVSKNNYKITGETTVEEGMWVKTRLEYERSLVDASFLGIVL